MRFDLPPYWDDLAVTWGGWEDTPQMFICPPPHRDVCPGCGSAAARAVNRGRACRRRRAPRVPPACPNGGTTTGKSAL